MVIVVNDNGRSYAPTVGGLSKQLSGLRTDPRYEKTLDVIKLAVSKAPLFGKQAYELLHGAEDRVEGWRCSPHRGSSATWG